jgi:hypothetical protein
MKRGLAISLLSLLALPGLVSAATVETGRAQVVAEPPAGNAYVFGGDVTVAAPVAGDLTAVGGSVVTSAPVSGDALIAGGSIDMRKPVSGDLRAIGGRITVEDAVTGDLVGAGGSITVSATPAFAWLLGSHVTLAKGAAGPVTVYGSTVDLAGTFAGDVNIVATDHLIIESGTVIKGALNYDAPERITLPGDASVVGPVTYTGKSFLPSSEEARTFAVAGATIFFAVRILAALIAAGLFAGVFPQFASLVADRALRRTPTGFAILALLGFGVIVAMPALILLLLVSFAGALLSFILLAAYVLLLLLAYVYAAVIAGAALAHALAKRDTLFWRDAVLGMLALSIIALVPVFGFLVVCIVTCASAGALVSLAYRFAFPKDEELNELL